MGLNWIFLTLLSVIFMSVGVYFSKKVLYRISPSQLLFYQYLASIITILMLGIFISRGIFFNFRNIWLVFLGFILGVGVFAGNKGVQINLSRSMIVKQFTNLFSIILSVVFLAELKLLDPRTVSGILLLASIPVGVISMLLMKGFGKGKAGFEWLVWNLVRIFLVGLVFFLAKLFVEDKSPFEVLFFQYIGCFMIISSGNIISKQKLSLDRRDFLEAILAGMFISTSLGFLYTAYSVAPLTYVNSLQGVGTTLLGVLIGLILFKEREGLTKKSTIGMLIGLISIIMLIVSGLLK